MSDRRDRVREKLSDIARELFWLSRDFPLNTPVNIEAKFGEVADAILSLKDEQGDMLAVLDPDQSLPLLPGGIDEENNWDAAFRRGFRRAMVMIEEGNWRKVL